MIKKWYKDVPFFLERTHVENKTPCNFNYCFFYSFCLWIIGNRPQFI